MNKSEVIVNTKYAPLDAISGEGVIYRWSQSFTQLMNSALRFITESEAWGRFGIKQPKESLGCVSIT